MEYTKGMKVNILGGDGVTPLGVGTYTGSATVYMFYMRDGTSSSLLNAEQKPDQELIDRMKRAGGTLCELENNPRFVLEDGRVVYGCQVWWSPIDD